MKTTAGIKNIHIKSMQKVIRSTLLVAGASLLASTAWAEDLLLFDHPQAITESSVYTGGMNQVQNAQAGDLTVRRFSSDSHDAERFVLSNGGQENLSVELSSLSLNALFQHQIVQSDDGIDVSLYSPVEGTLNLAVGELAVLESDYEEDGMADGWEIKHGLDMYSDDSAVSDDGDDLSNRNEFISGTNPSFHHSDTDVLADNAEVMVYGTDPHKKDTDDDGYNDHCEVIDGADPLDPESVPANYAQPDDCPFEDFFASK